MKRFLTLFIPLLLVLSLISCSESASDLYISDFETEIINRIPPQGEFEKNEKDSTTIYSRDDLEYTVKATENGNIISVTACIPNADTEYFKSLNFSDILASDPTRTSQMTASINAVRYCAMALTFLCDLQDEDSIDTVLDARSTEITESGFKIAIITENSTVRMTATYTAE